jgi:very-short-patch-repair endonuclease
MRANQHEIEHLLRSGGGIIARRAHPQLADALHHLVQQGRLRRILPGIYADPAVAELPQARMRAAAAWDPDVVLTGATAARLTFWPEVVADRIELALRGRRSGAPGFRFEQRQIPPELITTASGLRCTVPALTALDLCPLLGGDALDAALRSRMTTLEDLHDALARTPNRRGNAERRLLLADSRNEPWSYAERRTHRLFRAEGITGWVANYPLPLLGVLYYLDLAFPEIKLAVEIDGWAYHSSAMAFERDRWRQNDIVLAGWRVLRFTPRMLDEQPQAVVAMVRRAQQLMG